MYATFSLPEYHIQARPFSLPIASLQEQWQKYNHYPEYQRCKVWSYDKKRGLIHTIVSGLPMPPIFVLNSDHRYWIMDGQQRLTTIFEFLADGFATARLPEDPALPLVEPNRKFSQLSPETQEIIRNYAVEICIIEERDEASLGALFRRLQQQQPLNLAEQLWTYRHDTRKHVSRLMEHPFWKEIYMGKSTRRQPFLGSLYLLQLELEQGYTSVTPPRLRAIATGTREGSSAPELFETVWRRLDDVQHLFQGTMIFLVGESIPLYQAALFLEKYECDLQKSEAGCLTPWYREAKDASLQARHLPGKIDLLAKITHSKRQVEFWSIELPKVLMTQGLYRINKKRVFNATDRWQAWERQKGLCPVCQQPVKPTDEGHHIVQFKEGGATTTENCLIVHAECHGQLHAGIERNPPSVEDT